MREGEWHGGGKKEGGCECERGRGKCKRVVCVDDGRCIGKRGEAVARQGVGGGRKGKTTTKKHFVAVLIVAIRLI